MHLAGWTDVRSDIVEADLGERWGNVGNKCRRRCKLRAGQIDVGHVFVDWAKWATPGAARRSLLDHISGTRPATINPEPQIEVDHPVEKSAPVCNRAHGVHLFYQAESPLQNTEFTLEFFHCLTILQLRSMSGSFCPLRSLARCK